MHAKVTLRVPSNKTGWRWRLNVVGAEKGRGPSWHQNWLLAVPEVASLSYVYHCLESKTVFTEATTSTHLSVNGSSGARMDTL